MGAAGSGAETQSCPVLDTWSQPSPQGTAEPVRRAWGASVETSSKEGEKVGEKSI